MTASAGSQKVVLFRDPAPQRQVGRKDAEWPAQLDELGPHLVPEKLYVSGRPLPTRDRTIAVVGTRRPTVAGVEMTEALAKGLAQAGFTVVSGLAMGIDAAAHRAALEAGGSTVAVVGCGLDVNYPQRNERLRRRIDELGTVVSEHSPGTRPLPHHFPLRNRIIAGLSDGVVVVEGGDKSGALITARMALDANRSVFAVPGSARNPWAWGPNELIRTSQAALVTSVEHVFQELAPGEVWDGPCDPMQGQPPELERDESAVLFALDDMSASIGRVAETASVSTGAAALALACLEVRGYALRRRAGYEITGAGARVRGLLVSG